MEAQFIYYLSYITKIISQWFTTTDIYYTSSVMGYEGTALMRNMLILWKR